MRYYLDCEFNGYRGRLLSMALVRDDGEELYLVASPFPPIGCEPWVAENVVPVVFPDGMRCNGKVMTISLKVFPTLVEEFLAGDEGPVIVVDWPDDIRYFCETIIVGPGKMIDIPGLTFEVFRVDAYPTDLPGAVQHNALWDARALRHKLRAR